MLRTKPVLSSAGCPVPRNAQCHNWMGNASNDGARSLAADGNVGTSCQACNQACKACRQATRHQKGWSQAWTGTATTPRCVSIQTSVSE
eukprot:9906255-Alexandrium_andersonii.AAC.1